ncbi:hypothetical protein ACJW30_11G091500 [Castanea mollissima]
MQAKISTFFKNPISTSIAPKSPDPPPIFYELTIWENKQHQFFNTYSRRAQNPDKIMMNLIYSLALIHCFLHLDLGQSDFNLHTCSTCGVKYAPREEEDGKAHKGFHRDYTLGIPFKGWCSERVVHMPSIEGGRIVLVLDCDPIAHRGKVEEVVKMMEIELGSGWIFHKSCCLLAEPIKQAFKVCSCLLNGGSEGTSAKEVARQCSTSLQFGDISFKREVKKRTCSVNSSEVLDGNLYGAIICENEGVPAVCGIRAIWVTPSNRRKHIASQLLDAVRMSFCMGSVLELSQLALSQPTSAGKALASNYFSTGSFLVYKTNSLNSQMVN